MEKREYISPKAQVINVKPCTILAGSGNEYIKPEEDTDTDDQF